MNAQTPHSKKSGARRWTPKEINALIETILRYLPATIFALAVFVTACIAPDAITAGIGAIAGAIKALWR